MAYKALVESREAVSLAMKSAKIITSKRRPLPTDFLTVSTYGV